MVGSLLLTPSAGRRLFLLPKFGLGRPLTCSNPTTNLKLGVYLEVRTTVLVGTEVYEVF